MYQGTERRKEPRFKVQDQCTDFNTILDRYLALPYKKRDFVEGTLLAALKIAEQDC